MADNIDTSEDSKNDLQATESEKAENEIIPSNEQENLTQILDSENMEVHHHPNLHHKPKPWKEYLLEGFMIFLAVTLGFFAENFRESRVNKEKELNYIENLSRDLKGDKKTLYTVIVANEQMITALDTFVKIRGIDFSKTANNTLFFQLFSKTQMYSPNIFRPNEVTLFQIKSTGALNIIKPQIADLIAQLDVSNQNIKWVEKFPYTHGEETFRMIYELTDYPAIWTKSGDLNSTLPALITDDKKKLLKFFNLSGDLMYTMDGYNGNLKTHLTLIDTLLNKLKYEYNLEE
jgi:hypothetical protein